MFRINKCYIAKIILYKLYLIAYRGSNNRFGLGEAHATSICVLSTSEY